MVYCMTETNLCPSRPEIWECSTNKGSAAALPRYSSAVCPTVVRCTSAAGHMVLVFMTHLTDRWSGRGCCTLERQGMGYGTRPHDWELNEFESMKTLCLAVPFVYVSTHRRPTSMNAK